MKPKVLVENPHPQSMASYLLLKEYLATKVEYSDGYKGWLRFRFELLTRWLNDRGDLVCHYCGKSGLPIDHPSQRQVATIDHVIALANGGEMFNEANLVVACRRCNSIKGCK